MDPHDPSSSSGWLHHFNNVWQQEENTYRWIEYLFHEAEELQERANAATSSAEKYELQEKRTIVMRELTSQLRNIKTKEQRQFIMENFPFKNQKPSQRASR